MQWCGSSVIVSSRAFVLGSLFHRRILRGIAVRPGGTVKRTRLVCHACVFSACVPLRISCVLLRPFHLIQADASVLCHPANLTSIRRTRFALVSVGGCLSQFTSTSTRVTTVPGRQLLGRGAFGMVFLTAARVIVEVLNRELGRVDLLIFLHRVCVSVAELTVLAHLIEVTAVVAIDTVLRSLLAVSALERNARSARALQVQQL